MKSGNRSAACRPPGAATWNHRTAIWPSVLLILLLVGPPRSGAGAVVNDFCSSAEEIPSAALATAGAVYLAPAVEDMSLASNEGDPVSPDCVNVSAHSLWYRFVPATNASYTFSVGTDSGTTVQDTVLAVYESVDGSCTSGLTRVACVDDEASLQAALRVALVTNKTYFIVVWNGAVIPATPPNARVRLKVSIAAVPVNDECTGAIDIPASSLPHYTTPVDTTLATTTGDPSSPLCASIGVTGGVWYRFVPAESGGYLFSTRNTTNTTVLDTLIGIYTAATPCGGPYTRVACDDSGGGRATVGAQLTAGTPYYIVVWEGGTEEVTLSETLIELRVERARQPEVTTLHATNLLSTSAALTAAVNPNGLPTAVWFEWGETPQLGIRTSSRSVGSGESTVVTNRLIAGYLPNIVYYFRALATNAGGLASGDLHTFLYSTDEIRLAVPEHHTNGPFVGEFHGTPGQVYQVRASTNLVHWQTLGLATHVADGLHRFVDPGATNHPRRFYWILSP